MKIKLITTTVLFAFLFVLSSSSYADTLSNEVTFTRWAYTASIKKVKTKPGNKGRVITYTRWKTEAGLPELYVALKNTYINGQEYVKIRLPRRPNNSTGWVPREALGIYTKINTQFIIDRKNFTATLYKGDSVVWRSRIGVGKSGTPTPKGNFYVREKLKGFGDPLYGPYVFVTSAYSPTLTDWPRAGIIGIHGTNEPGILPGRVSHGCVRLRNSAIKKLWKKMPLGTPVLIK